MDRYDRGWMRGYSRDYGRDFSPGRPGRYGGDYGPPPRPRGSWGFWPGPAIGGGYGPPRGYGAWEMRPERGRGYDQDVYGRSYPGAPWMAYDRGYASRPFIPEMAYHEHPELDRPRHPPMGRRPDRSDSSWHGEMDDSEVQSAVERNLRQDEWVDTSSIRVDVQDRVVTLTGDVGDYLEARYAWDDAWETMGVRGVVNNLTVRLDEGAEKHREVFEQAEVDPGEGPAGSRKRQRPRR